ncbi:Hypothetical_protein [Hexamita inflata]|uniref:Hypothetical_protein n=1 Tax=Hexamita inflata TaxID=28002 RepID=A0AA86PAD0_9EUKA|nr:Hypothetical protein HINF_LOCUS20695 [Hexamita inflata]
MNLNQQIEQILQKEYEMTLSWLEEKAILEDDIQLSLTEKPKKKLSKAQEELEHCTALYRDAIYYMSYSHLCRELKIQEVKRMTYVELIPLISSLSSQNQSYFFDFIVQVYPEYNYTESYLKYFFDNKYCAQLYSKLTPGDKQFIVKFTEENYYKYDVPGTHQALMNGHFKGRNVFPKQVLDFAGKQRFKISKVKIGSKSNQ